MFPHRGRPLRRSARLFRRAFAGCCSSPHVVTISDYIAVIPPLKPTHALVKAHTLALVHFANVGAIQETAVRETWHPLIEAFFAHTEPVIADLRRPTSHKTPFPRNTLASIRETALGAGNEGARLWV